jgi:hypothetical protein
MPSLLSITKKKLYKKSEGMVQDDEKGQSALLAFSFD